MGVGSIPQDFSKTTLQTAISTSLFVFEPLPCHRSPPRAQLQPLYLPKSHPSHPHKHSTSFPKSTPSSLNCNSRPVPQPTQLFLNLSTPSHPKTSPLLQFPSSSRSRKRAPRYSLCRTSGGLWRSKSARSRRWRNEMRV